MKVIAFDLSSVCIGCVIAEVEDKEVTKIASCPIIPKKDTNIPIKLGFLKTKQKCENGLNSYIRYKGETVSKAEKKKRDSLVRESQNKQILDDISNKLSDVITSLKPDIVIMEKHAIFNGILTSVLLAKIAGILIGVAGDNHIITREYPVSQIRKRYNLVKMTREFVSTQTPESLSKIPDITKAAIGLYLSNKYNITFQTYDESDACAVFDYFFEEELKWKQIGENLTLSV